MAWPIVTKEHEDAVLDVLRARAMSGMDITKTFEREYADSYDAKYGLGCSSGTAAIQCAFYGMGIGVGDEVIAPSMTYWASMLQLFSLGATPVFADIDPDTLCIDPGDIENCISDRTKAIVVVHYAGMPADMDAIMAIADKHNLMVFEDCSHAHGCLYKGKIVGTIGAASGFSLMTGKSFAIGEAGIMLTNDQNIYERALLFGHYARHGDIELEENKKYAGLPCGGYKYRMHQLSSAFGRVQLKLWPKQMAEVAKAMNYFCDLMEDVPGIYPIRPAEDSGCTKGGWYFPIAKYKAEELGGLSAKRFADAIREEGHTGVWVGCNSPLHTHPVFREMDVYGHGRPTRVANLPESVTVDDLERELPVSEGMMKQILGLPRFAKFDEDAIRKYADAYRKVAENYKDLLEGDEDEELAVKFSSSKR